MSLPPFISPDDMEYTRQSGANEWKVFGSFKRICQSLWTAGQGMPIPETLFILKGFDLTG
jgi:hypothetical protein